VTLDEIVDQKIAKALEPLAARLAALEAAPTEPAPVEPPPVVVTPPPAAAGNPGPKALRVGTNLSVPAYYTPSWPFVDLMRLGQVNGSGVGDYSWMGTTGLPLDADGWPLEVREGQVAHTVLARMGGHYPAGDYTLSWEGQGRIALSGDASGTFTSSPTKVRVSPTSAGIDLKITLSAAANPVRNVRLVMPGLEGATFHPAFLDMLWPFSVLRFMDWGKTNDSRVTAWAERTRPTHRSQVKGVAYELMAELCNAVGADAWVCVPHRAQPAFTVEMAKLFREKLDPALKVYLEYSNEVWNGGFGANAYLEGLSSTENVRQTYARVATSHFRAWESGWGGRERLVRVLAGQAGNVDVLRQILTAAGPGACDAIASAPYFGGSLGKDATVATWSTDRVIQACLDDLPRWRDSMAAHKALADEHGVAHVAYEGGQHLAAVGTLTENAALVAKLAAANREPRMEQVYAAYLDHWRASGSGLFVHFNDVFPASKWGTWGMLEYQSQSLGLAPKARAIASAAAAWRN
jgi:hypothetical protein